MMSQKKAKAARRAARDSGTTGSSAPRPTTVEPAAYDVELLHMGRASYNVSDLRRTHGMGLCPPGHWPIVAVAKPSSTSAVMVVATVNVEDGMVPVDASVWALKRIEEMLDTQQPGWHRGALEVVTEPAPDESGWTRTYQPDWQQHGATAPHHVPL